MGTKVVAVILPPLLRQGIASCDDAAGQMITPLGFECAPDGTEVGPYLSLSNDPLAPSTERIVLGVEECPPPPLNPD